MIITMKETESGETMPLVVESLYFTSGGLHLRGELLPNSWEFIMLAGRLDEGFYVQESGGSGSGFRNAAQILHRAEELKTVEFLIFTDGDNDTTVYLKNQEGLIVMNILFVLGFEAIFSDFLFGG